METVKWVKPTNPAGVPVWEHGGILCTGEVNKAAVKLTFAQGAEIDTPALQALIRAAIAFKAARPARRR